MSGLVLALDTASRQVSVAIGDAERTIALRVGAQRGSSAHLLAWIDDCLREAGARLDTLAGAVALRGPGSFTGLRVGLATLLGFHQAIGLAATALPTLGVLAAAAPSSRRACAVVPAGPGEWFAQTWRTDWPSAALDEPQRVRAEDLGATAEAAGAELLVAGSDEEAATLPASLAIAVAGPLAAVAAMLAARHPPAWDAGLLRAPLYLAPAPVTVPGAPKRVLPVEERR